MSSERHLLLGLLALQLRLITSDQLVAGLQVWLANPDEPLSAILQRQQALTPRDLPILEALAEQHQLEQEPTPIRATDSLPSLVPPLPTGVLTSPPGHTSTPPSSGRYRPLREHARGGLGAVFLALDEELQRQVALKQIQPQLAHEPQCRSRFVREARVTALLEHPGVVPVHGLGSDADGQLFYAMRFIQGESYEQAIRQFHAADATPRDPGERSLALRGLLTRFVSVCQTLAYAHARGVIHRDLKPGNIMLGEYGETLVVDWGLAGLRADVAPAAGESPTPVQLPDDDLTRTRLGSALGTPAFMPPEQARGEFDRVGAASDIFALGATLYMVLTGKPPYRGSEALAQAREGRVPPPRQLRPDVPRALEAICLKALDPLPGERYGNARLLGEDVERWLADEPVSAYPDPPTVRLRRWARRHRTLVASSGLLVLLTTLGLALGLWFVRQEQARTSAALVESEKNFALARRAVDESLDVARNDRLLDRPDMLSVRRKLLEKALGFYEEFAARRPDSAGVQAGQAETFFRLGSIYLALGQRDRSDAILAKALRLDEAVADATPDDGALRFKIAMTRHNLAENQYHRGNPEQARISYQEARQHLTPLVAEFPNQTHYAVRLGTTLLGLVNALEATERNDEASQVRGEAIALVTGLVHDHPNQAEPKRLLGALWYNRGVQQADKGKDPAALEAFEKARHLQSSLVQRHPQFMEYRVDLARTLNSFAAAFLREKNYSSAARAFAEAIHLQQKVVAQDPSPENRRWLASYHMNLAITNQKQERLAAARDEYELALAALVEESPETLPLRTKAPELHSYLSTMLSRLNGHEEEAARHAAAAAQQWQRLIDRGDLPTTVSAKVQAGFHLQVRYLQRFGRYRQAAAVWARAASQLRPGREPLAVSEKRASVWAAQAVQLLRQGAAAGAFASRAAQEGLDTDPDLAFLRDRPDYLAFRASLPDRKP
ncbi:MAG: serine/threonine-protein kinase [Gemmataceae bacterium]